MTGLEKILKSIDDEARSISDGIINKAKKEAQGIIKKAKDIAKNESDLIIKNSEKEAEYILQRADSQIELQKREMILKAKREQIDDIINESQDALCKLPDDEYFNIILKLFEKHMQPLKGEIIFSKKDVDRIPRGFKTNISKLAKSIDGDIKVSEETRDISGGFILVYGDIEENCSFKAMFGSMYDLLSDKINELLFS